MNELVEFLLARIAEDEAAARKLQRRAQETRAMLKDPWFLGRSVPGWHEWPDVEALAARALAKCAAERLIVVAHGGGEHGCPVDDGIVWAADWSNPCATLRLLALPYADRPDFREEWRP